jgi:orotidine-5'-phosphate decarboxylase
MENFKEKVIIALDYGDLDSAVSLLEKLKGEAYFYKVGFEFFTSCGLKSVELVKDCGCKVFLDLKYHDIPNTVYKAVKAAARLGADIINVHASGGGNMMKAAKRGCDEISVETGRHIDIIAVTVLTSLSDSEVKQIFYGLDESPHGHSGVVSASRLTMHLAKSAKISGLDGVVCSGHESLQIKNILGNDFKTVTPGIRMKANSDVYAGAGASEKTESLESVKSIKSLESVKSIKSLESVNTLSVKTAALEGKMRVDDQKRIMTPSEAFNAGSDYIVVGRDITGAKNPADALKEIYEDIEMHFKNKYR